jgi:formate dehydrogenase subunit gamma
MSAVQPFESEKLAEILALHRDTPGAMLPVLHELQDTFGYVPAEAVPVIAKALNVSRAEVHGVITYYHHFREQPAGRILIQICRAEACQALGADALCRHAERSLHCAFHETTGDGALSLEPVYCLGQCAIGPAVQIGEQLFGRVTPARFDQIVADTEDTL